MRVAGRNPPGISSHALREEGDPLVGGLIDKGHISIHALREEGDGVAAVTAGSFFYFYPRPPRGGRLMSSGLEMFGSKFLSTPSARRATAELFMSGYLEMDFYPRPPRGGRLAVVVVYLDGFGISIHALREEGDILRLRECDIDGYFYPRPPRGGRPFGIEPSVATPTFLSTPSARRATKRGAVAGDDVVISIHALREEGDSHTAVG